LVTTKLGDTSTAYVKDNTYVPLLPVTPLEQKTWTAVHHHQQQQDQNSDSRNKSGNRQSNSRQRRQR